MPKGLPASYIIQARKQLPARASISSVFKRAWKLYKGSKVYEPLTRRVKTERGEKTLARRIYRRLRGRRRRSGFTLPLAPIAGLVVPFVAPPKGWGVDDSVVGNMVKGDYQRAFQIATLKFTGFEFWTGNFHFPWLIEGYGPMLIGALAHYIIGSKLGVNRMLGRAKVPIVRV